MIDKAVKELANGGALAKKETEWYITLMDFQPWVLDMLKDVIEENRALTLIGEPNSGKSPLGKSYLFAMCRRNVRVFMLGDVVVCVRVTPEIDFLRGEEARKQITESKFSHELCSHHPLI